MASLGEERIQSAAGRLLGQCHVRGIHSGTAIFPRLVIQLGISLSDIHPQSSGVVAFRGEEIKEIVRYKIVDIWGELVIGSHQTVGVLQWLSKRHHVHSFSYPNEDQVELICDLDGSRLAKLEQFRNGGDLDLSLALQFTTETLEPAPSGGTRPIDARVSTFRFSISRDEWLKFLERVGFSSARVFEIKFKPEPDDAFVRAMDYLSAAQIKVEQGRYNEAVANSRMVFDEITRRVPHERTKDVFEAHTHPSRAEQYTDILLKVKKLTNRAVHAQADPVTFSRHEAQFIVATTGYLLALLGDATFAQPSAGSESQ